MVKDDGSALQRKNVISGQLLILVNGFVTEGHVRAGGMSTGRKPRCVGSRQWVCGSHTANQLRHPHVFLEVERPFARTKNPESLKKTSPSPCLDVSWGTKNNSPDFFLRFY